MKIKKDILHKIQSDCSKALEFLTAKQKAIEHKERLLTKAESSIIKNLGKDGMSSEQQATIQRLKDDLHNEEFNEADIMKEQIFMSRIVQDINQALGKHKPSYADGLAYLKAQKDKYSNYAGILESRFNSINEENRDKQSLREKIVFNEKQLSKAKEKFNSFTKEYAPIYTSIKEREIREDKIKKEKERLFKELDKLLEIKSELEENAQKLYEKSVNVSIELENQELTQQEQLRVNELFQTNNLDLEQQNDLVNEVAQAKEKLQQLKDECDSQIADLQNQIDSLNTQIKDKDQRIKVLKQEKDWLLTQNVAQGIEISSLKTKLNLWQSSYDTFKQLVNDLAKFVGYDIKPGILNASGPNEGENPLIAIIRKVQDITEWVNQQEEFQPVEEEVEPEVIIQEKEHSHLGYILGGALLAAVALTMKK